MIKKTGTGARGLFLLSICGFLLAFGSISFIDKLQYSMPIFGKFGSPEQGFFIGQIFVVVLAAFGLQYLIKNINEIKASRNIAGVLILFTIMVIVGSKYFEVNWNKAFYTALILATLISMTAVVYPTKKVFRIAALLLVVLLQIVDLYGLAFLNLSENDVKRFDNKRWMKSVSNLIQKTNSRYVFTSARGLEDEQLLYHAGMALDMDGIDGWITVPPRRYAEFVALADKRAASFKNGKLNRLGLNSELKDGKFIDAESMPVLDLLSLRYIINRELPLKFSSPSFLGTVPAKFHKRTVIKGDHTKLEKNMIESESPAFHELIIAGPNELYQYELYVETGDRLRFSTEFIHKNKIAISQQVLFTVIIRLKGEDEVIYSEEESKAIQDIPLDNYAGKTIELKLLTKGPADTNDLVYIWHYPSIVNDGRPIKLKSVAEKDILVYENTESLPRAFVVNDYEVIEGDENMLSRLKKVSRYEFSQKVFLEQSPVGLVKQNKAVSRSVNASVTLDYRKSGEEVYKVTTDSNGLLFVSDQYYQGYKVFVKDVEKRILRTNYCFRSVPVEEGISIVRFVFQPVSFRVGLFVTLTSLVFIIFVVINILKDKRKKLVMDTGPES